MQTISSKIWTKVDMSISYDSNHYNMNKQNTKNQRKSKMKNRKSGK